MPVVGTSSAGTGTRRARIVPARMLAGTARLVRHRLRLTRLVTDAGWHWAFALSVVHLAQAAVPAATALAAGGVVAGIAAPGAGSVVATPPGRWRYRRRSGDRPYDF